MGKITQFWSALQAGKELSNVATWKNLQLATNALIAIVTLVVTFLPETMGFGEEDISTIAQAIALIGAGIVNAYFTAATTKKIGVRGKYQ